MGGSFGRDQFDASLRSAAIFSPSLIPASMKKAVVANSRAPLNCLPADVFKKRKYSRISESVSGP